MIPKSTAKIYLIGEYKITDAGNDHVLARDEVNIRQDHNNFRALTDGEWDKFALSKSARRFLPIAKNHLTGDKIIRILETDPSQLGNIIKEMGGVGYVILALENHLSKGPEDQLTMSREELQRRENEFDRYYGMIQSMSKDLLAPLIVHVLLHEDALNTLNSFIPAAERKNDAKENAKTALNIVLNNDAYLSAFKDLVSVSSFIFGQLRMKYVFEAKLTDALLKHEADCDKMAAQFIHFGGRKGINFKLYIFNNHVTLVYTDPRLPGGRVAVESTNGMIVDPEFYKNNQDIACLQLGLPMESFEAEPEKVVASVFVQHINDLTEIKKLKEMKRYMSLLEKLRPDDIALLITFQSLLLDCRDEKVAEEYRQKAVKILERKQMQK